MDAEIQPLQEGLPEEGGSWRIDANGGDVRHIRIARVRDGSISGRAPAPFAGLSFTSSVRHGSIIEMARRSPTTFDSFFRSAWQGRRPALRQPRHRRRAPSPKDMQSRGERQREERHRCLRRRTRVPPQRGGKGSRDKGFVVSGFRRTIAIVRAARLTLPLNLPHHYFAAERPAQRGIGPRTARRNELLASPEWQRPKVRKVVPAVAVPNITNCRECVSNANGAFLRASGCPSVSSLSTCAAVPLPGCRPHMSCTCRYPRPVAAPVREEERGWDGPSRG